MRSDHQAAWASSGITFKATTSEQRGRLADAAAERRKVWRYRVTDHGTMERRQFASRDAVPRIEGWATTEKAARSIARKLDPRCKPTELPAVIIAPAPARYRLDRPRCGARTRKATPCQAPALPNGRCRMHGGLSTGPRTPEGRRRCSEAGKRGAMLRLAARQAMTAQSGANL
jgi:hypothetical protein